MTNNIINVQNSILKIFFCWALLPKYSDAVGRASFYWDNALFVEVTQNDTEMLELLNINSFNSYVRGNKYVKAVPLMLDAHQLVIQRLIEHPSAVTTAQVLQEIVRICSSLENERACALNR